MKRSYQLTGDFDMNELTFHPVVDIFPEMSDIEFRELVEDIRENGLLEPVWVYDGQVIDGRHRVKACRELDIEVDIFEYDGDESSIVSFVTSLNLTRRHLSDSQRAMIGARLTTLKQGDNQFTKDPPIGGTTSQSEAADILNTSQRAIQRASKVQRDGIPELIDAVDAGEVSIAAAVEVSSLEPEEQLDIISSGSESIRERVKEIRESKKPHVTHNSGDNEWYTPQYIIDKVREVMGGIIDCDPATSRKANDTVEASVYWTKEDNGLEQQWCGNVFMNPPYSQPLISQFSEAVVEKLESGEIEQAIVLVNNATETGWFQGMLSKCSSVCFPKGRIKFIDEDGNPSGSPLQGQAILYFGDNLYEFETAFSDIGVILS